jgi:hypothetical protein
VLPEHFINPLVSTIVKMSDVVFPISSRHRSPLNYGLRHSYFAQVKSDFKDQSEPNSFFTISRFLFERLLQYAFLKNFDVLCLHS